MLGQRLQQAAQQTVALLVVHDTVHQLHRLVRAARSDYARELKRRVARLVRILADPLPALLEVHSAYASATDVIQLARASFGMRSIMCAAASTLRRASA